MKDNEILAGLVSDFEAGCCTEEKTATLRKYAAIARAVEAGTWKLVPMRLSPDMAGAGSKAARNSQVDGHRLIAIWEAELAAAPQFQEEGK